MALVWVATSLAENTLFFYSTFLHSIKKQCLLYCFLYVNIYISQLICCFFPPFSTTVHYNHWLAPWLTVSAPYRPTDLSSCWGGSSSVLMTTQSWPLQRKQMEPQGDVSIQLTTWVSQGGMNRCSFKDGKGVRCRSRLPYAKVRVR